MYVYGGHSLRLAKPGVCASGETWREGGTTGSLAGVQCARAGVCQHTVSTRPAHREPQQTEKAPGPPGDRRYRWIDWIVIKKEKEKEKEK